jgi:hypothetical protein
VGQSQGQSQLGNGFIERREGAESELRPRTRGTSVAVDHHAGTVEVATSRIQRASFAVTQRSEPKVLREGVPPRGAAPSVTAASSRSGRSRRRGSLARPQAAARWPRAAYVLRRCRQRPQEQRRGGTGRRARRLADCPPIAPGRCEYPPSRAHSSDLHEGGLCESLRRIELPVETVLQTRPCCASRCRPTARGRPSR